MARPTPNRSREALRRFAETRYARLADLLEQLAERAPTLFNASSKEVVDAARLRAQLPTGALQAALQELGVREYAYAGHGGSALVLDHGRHRVVRISLRRREPRDRPKLPCVLQAIETYAASEVFRVEILPRLRHGATVEHVFHLAVELAKLGRLFLDPIPENVGLLPDGTPLVIDPGMLIPENQLSDLHRARLHALQAEPPSLFRWVASDGMWKQARLFPH